jgi:hypothetical protein
MVPQRRLLEEAGGVVVMVGEETPNFAKEVEEDVDVDGERDGGAEKDGAGEKMEADKGGESERTDTNEDVGAIPDDSRVTHTIS